MFYLLINVITIYILVDCDSTYYRFDKNHNCLFKFVNKQTLL